MRIGDFGLALNIGVRNHPGHRRRLARPTCRPSRSATKLVDHRTDLYSLGVVMYQMLSGTLPYRGGQQVQHDLPDHAVRAAAAVEPPPRGDRVARPHRAPRDAEGPRAALPERRRARRGPDRGAARRTSASSAAASFGDADKFVALRNMRFFSAFADPELWEVVALGSWKRVAGRRAHGAGRRARRLLLHGGPGRGARKQEQEAARRCSVPASASARWPTFRLRSHERGATVTAARDSRDHAGEGGRPRARPRPTAAASSTAPSSASWSSGSISRTPV